MVSGLINANPIIYEKKERRIRSSPVDPDEYSAEPIDELEIFDILFASLFFNFFSFYVRSFPGVVKFSSLCMLGFELIIPCLLQVVKSNGRKEPIVELGCCFCLLIFLTFSHHIRDIKDPEHPYSLEELKVITEDAIEVDDKRSYVRVTFTPTVEHCSMATVIGLCLRVKLMRSLPSRYKVDIRVAPGTHATEAAVNKQLNDKERIAAALENPNLVDMVDECLAPSFA
ncbi:hypothetical protein Tsubulata_038311 [Turnera subulata]|uniref:MIP18 family-like domain-containing protein n=1 Tax=Turnera subulata TaxID=218843 RepID=A0A9Q0G5B5_9ROSI|nr:hypothetical protein Tsubulata_038311 [Turnera subulata]